MKNILVCTDGSSYSLACYEHAINLAKLHNAHVDVLYVTDVRIFEFSAVADFGGAMGAQPYTGVMDQIQNAERAKAEIIQKIAEKFFTKKDYADHMTFHYVRGFMVDIIKEFEESDLGVDLIVMGKRGEHFENFKDHIGATMERVIKETQTPCLITSSKYVQPKKILLAYDGSEHSRAAVRGILRSEKAFGGEVHVVTVQAGGDAKEQKAQLQEITELLQKNGFRVYSELLKGDVGNAIVKYIKSNDINWLMMGAYGQSGFKRLLVGSKTTELLTRTEIPVVIYRNEE